MCYDGSASTNCRATSRLAISDPARLSGDRRATALCHRAGRTIGEDPAYPGDVFLVRRLEIGHAFQLGLGRGHFLGEHVVIKAALAFVNRIGDIAEAQNHHPDIHFGWGYVEVVLTTHSAGGLTLTAL